MSIIFLTATHEINITLKLSSDAKENVAAPNSTMTLTQQRY